MDLVKEAIFLGFSGAAVMDTKELLFAEEGVSRLRRAEQQKR